MLLLRCLVGVLLCLMVQTGEGRAAPRYPAWTNAEAAGPDFEIQGEYLGDVGGEHAIAAQVIALGEGRFEGVLYAGGLPGGGWDDKTRFHFRGDLRDGEAHCIGIHGEQLRFDNANFSGLIRDGRFHGRAEMFRNVVNDSRFEMRKVFRQSPTLGAPPPTGALILFQEGDLAEWVDARLTEEGHLAHGALTQREFNSVKLHLEFRCPFMPTATGMHRGNSGVFFKRREWEVQIVDSFGWDCQNRKFERLADVAGCGSIHEMVMPRLNMSLPPLSWQTFDLEFRDAVIDDKGDRIRPAMLTVQLNGVLVQDQFVLPRVAPGRDPETCKEGQPGPIWLQDHRGDPVSFRNIWIVELEKSDALTR